MELGFRALLTKDGARMPLHHEVDGFACQGVSLGTALTSSQRRLRQRRCRFTSRWRSLDGDQK
jgi:hypothetical protein